MDLNQLRRLKNLPHLSSYTDEDLYSKLPLYERILISTCDVVYREAVSEADIPQVYVSPDVQRLHNFCQGNNPVMLPCRECRLTQTFFQEKAWNPLEVATDNQKGKNAKKHPITTRLPVSHQIDQMTGKSIPPDRPAYRFGSSHLSDVDNSLFQENEWDSYKKGCGYQCKREILKVAQEFRKDICCSFNAEHSGFADFILVPAVSEKPHELVNYEERKASAEATCAGTAVLETAVEKEARELYDKYCQDICLIKVGQYPALKDMQLFNTEKYRRILKGDYKYYTLSIALAGEGVGIGAFTYLRRIFENVVESVHQQCVAECAVKVESEKADTGEQISTSEFDEDGYRKLSFNEKISYLEENYNKTIIPHELEPIRSKLYGVLSEGIHKSSEDECLELYHSVRFIIEIFLDDKIQKAERQKKLDEATKKINSR